MPRGSPAERPEPCRRRRGSGSAVARSTAPSRLGHAGTPPHISTPTTASPVSQSSASRPPHSRRSQLARIRATKTTITTSGRHCSSYGNRPNRMKRNFSPIKAQHAPPPRQARPLSACQTASTSPQRIIGGIVTASNHTAPNVRTVLRTLLNRLARSQPIGPREAEGGRSSASGGSWCRSFPPVFSLPASVRKADCFRSTDRRGGGSDASARPRAGRPV